MAFYEDDRLFAVVNRQVEYRTVVLGTEDRVHSSRSYYYLLGFHVPRPGGTAELLSIQEVYSRSQTDGQCAPNLQDPQLASLVSHKRGNLFLPENEQDVPNRPPGAWAGQVRRWDDKLWFLILGKDRPTCVTDESQSVTYTCPPTDVVKPLWRHCWDVEAGLILFTETKSMPPYELGYLPPRAYLWYYRENRVETYTIDRVAVNKALRQFIRKQK